MNKKNFFYIILYTIIFLTLHNIINKKNNHFINYYSLHTIIFPLHNNLVKKNTFKKYNHKSKKNINIF